ncbi:DUF1501 domain-containing protein [Tautonia sp. JC769]|uniref:DUF1501 domain-containing protein n=1 Tax=Tautonia sp. JC769 TaxID=3232135 RepID=UPI00345A895C
MRHEPIGCREFVETRTSRRQILQIGVLGWLGLGLADVLKAEGSGRGLPIKAKSVIFLHQFGGASHHDTFDMKPDAPAEIRGEFNPIASNLPGVQVCELLPKMATVMDKVCLVRSVNHRTGAHNSATYYSLTGHKPLIDIVTANATATDFPAYGSIVDKLAPSPPTIPTAVSLPTMIADGPFRTPGEFAGFLGKQHDPLFILKDPNKPEFSVEELSLPLEVPTERAGDRRAMLSELTQFARLGDQLSAVKGMNAYQQRAFDLLTSPETQRAFDIHSEPESVRERYGRTTYGQSVLMARRLVEAGVRFVTVYYSPNIGGWDTHKDNFNTLRDSRLPITDQTLPTLLEDLDERGMLDDTMVVWTGEFGRTPRINKDAGRDHWPQCYTILMAGGGLKRGYVHGASDASGAYPKSDPCTPDDISATMFHCLGIDPATELRDQLNRPIPVSYGSPIAPILA